MCAADRHALGHAVSMEADRTCHVHLAGKQREEADRNDEHRKDAAFKDDAGVMPRTTRLTLLSRRSTRLMKCVMVSS